MPRKGYASYPAELWYEAQAVFGGTKAKNALYRKHDAHVQVWKSWAHLRLYQPKYDHEAHVRNWEQRCGRVVNRNSEYAPGPMQDRCRIWTNALSKGHTQPTFHLLHKNGTSYNAITIWQRLRCGVVLPPKMVWGASECGNKSCIHHRYPVTRSEYFTRAAQEAFEKKPSLKVEYIARNRRNSGTPKDIVLRIHELAERGGLSMSKIGELVGRPKATVAHILRGNRWAGVKEQPSPMSAMAQQLMGVRP
jgi:hypothetical protein